MPSFGKSDSIRSSLACFTRYIACYLGPSKDNARLRVHGFGCGCYKLSRLDTPWTPSFSALSWDHKVFSPVSAVVIPTSFHLDVQPVVPKVHRFCSSLHSCINYAGVTKRTVTRQETGPWQPHSLYGMSHSKTEGYWMRTQGFGTYY
jgi:hypothetical protein